MRRFYEADSAPPPRTHDDFFPNSIVTATSHLLPPPNPPRQLPRSPWTSPLMKRNPPTKQWSAASHSVIPFDQLTDLGPMSLENPYSCPVCGRSFFDKTKFRHHYMVHTGERPYACKFCSFRATQVGNLNKHIREKHPDNVRFSLYN